MKMIDIAVYNAFILYCEKNPEFRAVHGKHSRRIFLKLLSSKMLTIRTQKETIVTPVENVQMDTRKWCQICDRNNRKKTSYKCAICGKNVCPEHRTQQIKCVKC